jgi:dTDP-4-amino-4,6-dideoxygalactose transaminase
MPTPTIFTKDWGAPDALPEASVAAALEVIRSARIHRYQHADPSTQSEVSRLESEFADMCRRRYCAAVNSCGSALFLALKGLGVGVGSSVLVNAHTLTPVPSAIVHTGAKPVFVESDAMGLLDLRHLASQISAHPEARVLLLSHMRGRVCDMERVARMCADSGVALVEDCAHALGSAWDGRPCGSFGVAACYSAQTNKLVNAGEGGLLVTDDETVAGRAILHSGSYGFCLVGHARAPPERVLRALHDDTPNFSLRMTELTAALLRPQLAVLERKVAQRRAAQRSARHPSTSQL